MTITTIGIDLAKNVFAVHGVDQNGRTVLIKPKVSRAALPELIGTRPEHLNVILKRETMRTPVLVTKEKFVTSLDNYKTSLSYEGLYLKNKEKTVYSRAKT